MRISVHPPLSWLAGVLALIRNSSNRQSELILKRVADLRDPVEVDKVYGDVGDFSGDSI